MTRKNTRSRSICWRAQLLAAYNQSERFKRSCWRRRGRKRQRTSNLKRRRVYWKTTWIRETRFWNLKLI